MYFLCLALESAVGSAGNFMSSGLERGRSVSGCFWAIFFLWPSFCRTGSALLYVTGMMPSNPGRGSSLGPQKMRKNVFSIAPTCCIPTFCILSIAVECKSYEVSLSKKKIFSFILESVREKQCLSHCKFSNSEVGSVRSCFDCFPRPCAPVSDCLVLSAHQFCCIWTEDRKNKVKSGWSFQWLLVEDIWNSMTVWAVFPY